jgi:outer membrane protein OmpA-like peptidoglycan-associated protein
MAEEPVQAGSKSVPEVFPSVMDGISKKKTSARQEHDDLPTPGTAPSAFLEQSSFPANLSGLIEGTIPVSGQTHDPLEDLKEEQGTEHGGGTPTGFSSLDGLLEGKQPLSLETAPILMPTDLLFEYDSATLRKEAEMALKKLGTLMNRNPHAGIRIEGHTDSFGGDDYNLSLSQRRAEEVKSWLVAKAGIGSNRITTEGFGKTRLLAPASGSIGEQRLNRRVEIVITQGGENP